MYLLMGGVKFFKNFFHLLIKQVLMGLEVWFIIGSHSLKGTELVTKKWNFKLWNTTQTKHWKLVSHWKVLTPKQRSRKASLVRVTVSLPADHLACHWLMNYTTKFLWLLWLFNHTRIIQHFIHWFLFTQRILPVIECQWTHCWHMKLQCGQWTRNRRKNNQYMGPY